MKKRAIAKALAGGGVMWVSALLGTGTAEASTVPTSHPSYLTWGDAATFNFNLLLAAGAIPSIPSTPSGNIPFIRMFTGTANGGNALPALGGDFPDAIRLDNTNTAGGAFNGGGVSTLWYGADYDGNGDVAQAMTGAQLLTFIQAKDPGSNTPVFGFDQNQVNNGNPNANVATILQRDILLTARVFLINQSIVGLDAAQVQALAANPVNTTVFTMFDTLNLFNQGGFVLAPGEFTHPSNLYPVVDNNGAGNAPDWGAIVPVLNLNNYLNHSVLVEVKFRGDTNGFEEFYILGGTNAAVVPLPRAAWAGIALLGLVGVVRGVRRHRLA